MYLNSVIQHRRLFSTIQCQQRQKGNRKKTYAGILLKSELELNVTTATLSRPGRKKSVNGTLKSNVDSKVDCVMV